MGSKEYCLNQTEFLNYSLKFKSVHIDLIVYLFDQNGNLSVQVLSDWIYYFLY